MGFGHKSAVKTQASHLVFLHLTFVGTQIETGISEYSADILSLILLSHTREHTVLYLITSDVNYHLVKVVSPVQSCYFSLCN